MDQKLRSILFEGAEKIKLTLDEKQITLLIEYLKLLEKWNKAYNLTAVRNIEEMAIKHVLDSLAVLPFLESEKIQSIADVGSGAGLPGLPFAIVHSAWQVVLIDSNGKKTGFLNQVKTSLGLNNLTIVNGRVEGLCEKYDAVISRAFTSLKEMVVLTASICREDTSIWAMKGKYPEQELRELPKPYMVSASYALNTPFCEGERHLLRIVKGQA